jgi:hypothetical protein
LPGTSGVAAGFCLGESLGDPLGDGDAGDFGMVYMVSSVLVSPGRGDLPLQNRRAGLEDC